MRVDRRVVRRLRTARPLVHEPEPADGRHDEPARGARLAVGILVAVVREPELVPDLVRDGGGARADLAPVHLRHRRRRPVVAAHRLPPVRRATALPKVLAVVVLEPAVLALVAHARRVGALLVREADRVLVEVAAGEEMRGVVRGEAREVLPAPLVHRPEEVLRVHLRAVGPRERRGGDRVARGPVHLADQDDRELRAELARVNRRHRVHHVDGLRVHRRELRRAGARPDARELVDPSAVVDHQKLEVDLARRPRQAAPRGADAGGVRGERRARRRRRGVRERRRDGARVRRTRARTHLLARARVAHDRQFRRRGSIDDPRGPREGLVSGGWFFILRAERDDARREPVRPGGLLVRGGVAVEVRVRGLELDRVRGGDDVAANAVAHAHGDDRAPVGRRRPGGVGGVGAVPRLADAAAVEASFGRGDAGPFRDAAVGAHAQDAILRVEERIVALEVEVEVAPERGDGEGERGGETIGVAARYARGRHHLVTLQAGRERRLRVRRVRRRGHDRGGDCVFGGGGRWGEVRARSARGRRGWGTGRGGGTGAGKNPGTRRRGGAEGTSSFGLIFPIRPRRSARRDAPATIASASLRASFARRVLIARDGDEGARVASRASSVAGTNGTKQRNCRR